MAKKYGGMKKASDWAYKRVRLTRAVRNGMGEVPKGTKGVISCTFIKDGRIHFDADPCECCGAKFVVSGLRYEAFELIEE